MEKLTFGKDPWEGMKRQVSPIIGTIITKRSSAAFVRTIFCRSCGGRLTTSSYNCDVALRPRFHAYVVSVYSAAMTIFDNKNCKSADWFEEHIVTMAAAIEEKRKAIIARLVVR